jgi:hypothetical protein
MKIIVAMIIMLIIGFMSYQILEVKKYSGIEFRLENASNIIKEAYVDLISPIERRKFVSKIKQPSWFYDKPAKVVNNIKEVQKLWSSKKRCCVDANILLENNREFFRGCYNAIANNIENDKVVVMCLSLMGSTDKDKERRYNLNRYVVDNYIDHKNDISNCANCDTGDRVTRTVKSVAYAEVHKGNLPKGVKLLEDILKNRNDAAPWIQVETLEQLARLYLKNKVTEEQKTFMNKKYNSLLEVGETNEPVKRRIPALQKLVDKINMQ